MKNLQWKSIFIYITLVLLTLVLVFFSLRMGAAPLSENWLSEIFQYGKALVTGIPQSNAAAQTTWAIVMDIRLPRIIAALLAGGGLALAGTLMQGLFQNPLAGPEILGISSGASLGAVVAIVTGLAASSFTAVPLSAVLGALGSASFIYLISRSQTGTVLLTVVLAGLALSGFLGGVISTFLLLARPYEINQFIFWTMGGLEGRLWSHISYPLPLIIIGTLGALASTRKLDLFALGEEAAHSSGVGVERSKILMLGSATLLTAGAIAMAGPIGFIGLITPHFFRLLLGPGHRILLPAAALGGGLFLLGADLLGRTLIAPFEIKAGVIPALLGSPYFLFLVIRRRGRS